MEQIEQVNLVLKEIGADHIPQILVWNKIDAAGHEPSVERDQEGRISRVFLSARTGDGLDLLRDAISEAAQAGPTLSPEQQDQRFTVSQEDEDEFEEEDAPVPTPLSRAGSE